jgi:hypothetical protein
LFLGRLRLGGSRFKAISKITKVKWTGGVIQEYLLCKHEALNSNPSPTNRKKKKLGSTIPELKGESEL